MSRYISFSFQIEMTKRVHFNMHQCVYKSLTTTVHASLHLGTTNENMRQMAA